MNKYLRELRKRFPAWRVCNSGKHVRLIHKKTGVFVICSSTPNAAGAFKMIESDCRRVLREHKEKQKCSKA